MLHSLVLLVPLMVGQAEKRAVAIVLDVKGTATVQSGDMSGAAKPRQVLFLGDTLTTEADSGVLVFFSQRGLRQQVRAKSNVKVTATGCAPVGSITTLDVPKQYPTGPDFDSKQKAAGVSWAMNKLDKTTADRFAVAMADGAIKPSYDEGVGEVFFQIENPAKLEQAWANQPPLLNSTREAIFQFAALNREDDAFRWILAKQPAEDKIAQAYAAFLNARALQRDGDDAKADALFDKAESLRTALLQANPSIVMSTLLTPPQPAKFPGGAAARFLLEAFQRVSKADEETKQYGFKPGISILGAWLRNGDTNYFGLPLTKNIKYVFLAAGDNDAQCIDLRIEDDKGRSVVMDKRIAPYAILSFTPPETGNYFIRLTLLRSGNNVPCVCAMCLLQENGLRTPIANLGDCAKEIAQWIQADKKLQANGLQLGFRHARGQWAVYGAVLDKKAEASINNIDLGVGRRALYALGDKAAKDVDLFLLNNKGDIVFKDESEKSDALIDFTSVNNQLYGLKMRNFDGARAIVVSSIFEVRKLEK